MIIDFYKFQGTGNDFIMIDDREGRFNTKDEILIAAEDIINSIKNKTNA